MPQMGLEVTEGTVVALHVEAGATVAEGDALLEMETDKALTDVVAPHDGVLVEFVVAEGDTVEIGATLARLDGGGEPAARGETAAPRTAVAGGGVAAAGGAVAGSATALAERPRGAHTIK